MNWKRVSQVSENPVMQRRALAALRRYHEQFVMFHAGQYLKEQLGLPRGTIGRIMGNALIRQLYEKGRLKVAGTVGLAYWYRVAGTRRPPGPAR